MQLKNEVAFGIHSVLQLMDVKPENIKELWIQQGTTNKRLLSLVDKAEKLGLKAQFVRKSVLDKEAESQAHQGVLVHIKARLSLDERSLYEYMDKIDSRRDKPLFLILDSLDDPQNLGACLRTAECAGVTAVILTRDKNPKVSSPVVRKVACGAVDLMPVYEITNLASVIKKLKDYGVWIVGTYCDAKANSVFKTDLAGPIGIIMGSEGKGLRRLTKEACDFLTFIPLSGSIDSLNVSVAAGVVLFEARRQRMVAEVEQPA